MIRNATAVWNGGKQGTGHLTTQSNVLNKSQYSYNSRFEDAVGTNPEELVAAAHAGCFTMKLSIVLVEKGFTADTLQTKCSVTLENGSITKSHLEVEGKIPEISEEEFQEAVKNAAQNCPISKSIKAEITYDAKLIA